MRPSITHATYAWTPGARGTSPCPRCAGANCIAREPARLVCRLCGWQRDLPDASYRDHDLQRVMDAQLRPVSAECWPPERRYVIPTAAKPDAHGRVRSAPARS